MAQRARVVSKKSSAFVALVAAGLFASAVGTFAFHEAVGQETLVMLAVQHLCLLAEDVAVLVDFHQGLPERTLCAQGFRCSCNCQRMHPIVEELGYSRVVSVREILSALSPALGLQLLWVCHAHLNR